MFHSFIHTFSICAPACTLCMRLLLLLLPAPADCPFIPVLLFPSLPSTALPAGLPGSGEGKPRMLDEKETSVYKRALDVEYKLKLKASRAVFSEIGRRFPAMPFTTRALTGALLLLRCSATCSPTPHMYTQQQRS